ncbi:MAG TPA: flavin reductase family protein, partial [Acidocella sp.]|nr:flavin reductase family protein [Acidocella sp.]
SLRNVEETGELVWNLTTRAIGEQMNQTCAAVPYGTDEFAISGLTPIASKHVAPPRVAESPVHFECKVTDIIPLKTYTGALTKSKLVLAEVIAVYIAKYLLKDGIFDTFNAGIILRAGGASAYAEIKPESRFDMMRP